MRLQYSYLFLLLITNSVFAGRKSKATTTTTLAPTSEEQGNIDVASYNAASEALQKKYVSRYNKLFLKYIKPLEKLKSKTDNQIKTLYGKYLDELNKWRNWYDETIEESKEPKKTVAKYTKIVTDLEEKFILEKVKMELKLAAKKSEADGKYEIKREKLQLWFEDKLRKLRLRYLSTHKAKP